MDENNNNQDPTLPVDNALDREVDGIIQQIEKLEALISIEIISKENEVHLKIIPPLPGMFRTWLPDMIERFFESRTVNEKFKEEVRKLAYWWLASRFEAGLLLWQDGKIVEPPSKKKKNIFKEFKTMG